MTLKDTLHKVEHALLDSKDEEGARRKAEDAQRDREAEAKLAKLQQHHAVGQDTTTGSLSTVPPAQEHVAVNRDLAEQHVEPTLARHHRAEDTGLRPDSQEHMDGVGTAGDDRAI